MDDIVEDTRREVEVLLTAWETQGPKNEGIFRPHVGESTTMSPKSDASSDFEINTMGSSEETGTRNRVRFVISDLSGERYKDDDGRLRPAHRLSNSVSPGSIAEETESGTSGSAYFDVA